MSNIKMTLEDCDSILYDAFHKSQEIKDYIRITKILESVVSYDKGLELGDKWDKAKEH